MLSGVFKFGSTPVKAKGTMQLAESASGALTASEKWKGRALHRHRVLGPREIEFDVNKLIINLLNVAISAASSNQASDVEGFRRGAEASSRAM